MVVTGKMKDGTTTFLLARAAKNLKTEQKYNQKVSYSNYMSKRLFYC